MDANGTSADGSKEAPGGYELDVDHRDIVFAKRHADGRVTSVRIETRMGDCSLSVMESRGREEIGHERLGAVQDRGRAKEIAREWMAENPDGVTA